MKIVTGPEEWREKRNFVDENNVVVGWDYEGQCCERYGYFFDERKHDRMPDYDTTDPRDPLPDDLTPYRFDPAFFEETSEGVSDAGAMAIFRLTAPNKPDLFLHLYNSHNGYYSHGFTVSVGGQQTRSGSL